LPRLTDVKNDQSPLARAAVGRALGLANLDNRKGVGVFRHNGIVLPDFEWKQIPAGEFQCGHENESDNPPQTITLDEFYLSRFPVTVAQFQTFVDDAEGASQKRWYKGLKATDEDREISPPYYNYFNHAYANHPRDSVNWYQAVAFTRWLAWRYGLAPDELRLPTEFEWEKAARGPTGNDDGRLYPYQGKFDAKKGNVRETDIGQTSAVGIFPQGASPYGVEEMSGNVWEWCLSNDENPAREAKDEDLNTKKSRVLRGGSWIFNVDNARSVYRLRDHPGARLNDVGFRVLVFRPPSFLKH
jgi:formylglycine-generating enzyme required for sulfatase activity